MMEQGEKFRDRRDAGRQLAERLKKYRGENLIVLGMPRGGVVVAYEIARMLQAPLDVAVARKIGAPPQPELGIGAVAPGGIRFVNPRTVRMLGLTEAQVNAVAEKEEAEMQRRLQAYRGVPEMPDVNGKIVLLVDDGLATGVTAQAAARSIRRMQPEKLILAVAACAPEGAALLAEEVDEVVCVQMPEAFYAVGMWFEDFEQNTDEEVLDLLEKAKAFGAARPRALPATADAQVVEIPAGEAVLHGDLTVPKTARGVVVFAPGSGSSRFSSRNRFVAKELQKAGLATLLMDLLTEREEQRDRLSRHLRFDIPLLAGRLGRAIQWLGTQPQTAKLPVGLFGASTGGGAALIAAAQQPDIVKAVVSRGGRPDLAREHLPNVQAPTLLIVGARDVPVIELNEQAMAQMHAPVELEIVPHATHLFEEPGTLEEVARLASEFFKQHLSGKLDGQARKRPRRPDVFRRASDKSRLIARAAEPFDTLEAADLAPLLDRIGQARVVLLGEASHGTSEFYRMRARITQALIARKGFNIVAVESDWPDAEHMDEYVRHRAGKPERAAYAFSRFPMWMWRNTDVMQFAEWLRGYNEDRPETARVGFYGLDLYSLNTSIQEVITFLEARDPDLAEEAKARYGCFTPFSGDPARYGQAVVFNQYRGCEQEAVAMLTDLLEKRLPRPDGKDALFDATQNARVVANAEQYYRVMYYGSAESWNLRDRHMFETLQALLKHRGPDSRAVVWAHNSHLGNAAATEMARRGEFNVGQLVKEEYGDDAYSVGFGTHTGTVAAASNWGGEVEIKRVRPSHPQSYERLCHDSGVPNFLLPLHERHADPKVRHELMDPRLERAIGVIYRPETELQSHYFAAILPQQFDEYIWFDESEAVTALEGEHAPDLPTRHPFLLGD